MNRIIRNHLSEAAVLYRLMDKDALLREAITQAAARINEAFMHGHRLYIAGNGGSAAQAQHFAAELVGKYKSANEKPLPALAITTDSSFLTAWVNDMPDGAATLFERQLLALGQRGDVFFAISTSGRSKNILRALTVARELGMVRMALVGNDTNAILQFSDIVLSVPSLETPYIQEMHLAVVHTVCECINR